MTRPLRDQDHHRVRPRAVGPGPWSRASRLAATLTPHLIASPVLLDGRQFPLLRPLDSAETDLLLIPMVDTDLPS